MIDDIDQTDPHGGPGGYRWFAETARENALS